MPPITTGFAAATFQKYLDTVSGGCVVAERSFIVDRIKLVCKKCEATRTLPGNTAAYVKEGLLDWGLQQWVKEHAHKEPTGLPTRTPPKFKYVPKLPSVGPITPPGGTESKPKPPLKTEGRKIR